MGECFLALLAWSSEARSGAGRELFTAVIHKWRPTAPALLEPEAGFWHQLFGRLRGLPKALHRPVSVGKSPWSRRADDEWPQQSNARKTLLFKTPTEGVSLAGSQSEAGFFGGGIRLWEPAGVEPGPILSGCPWFWWFSVVLVVFVFDF